MIRFLLCLLAVLALAAVAEAGHRAGLFGRARERVVVRERSVGVFRGNLLRGGAGCAGSVASPGAGCVGVTVRGGCSGYAGPGLNVPAPAVVPAPMPGKGGVYWPSTPFKK